MSMTKNEWLDEISSIIDKRLESLNETDIDDIKYIEDIDNVCDCFEYNLCGNCAESMGVDDTVTMCFLGEIQPYNNYLKAIEDNDIFMAISSLVLLKQGLGALRDKE